MNLCGTRECEATREKLRQLKEHYRARLMESAEPTFARELSLESLKKTINQLTEELARYDAHVGKK